MKILSVPAILLVSITILTGCSSTKTVHYYKPFAGVTPKKNSVMAEAHCDMLVAGYRAQLLSGTQPTKRNTKPKNSYQAYDYSAKCKQGFGGYNCEGTATPSAGSQMAQAGANIGANIGDAIANSMAQAQWQNQITSASEDFKDKCMMSEGYWKDSVEVPR